MVLASFPVHSERRFAALPVGAQRAIFMFLAVRMVIRLFTRVVFPTPGPPVMVSIFEFKAFCMASF